MAAIDFSRRDFLQSAAAVVALGATTTKGQEQQTPRKPPSGSVVISSANGLRATEKAATMIAAGADTLDAVVAGVNIVEEDPEDNSVGYGGLPNEDGIVELDASVMHGPTRGCGAVAALRNIKTPSSVARLVMQRTDHIMLVGEGALKFAKAHGFKEYDLLTEKSREAWLEWKEKHSDKDNWLPPPDPPASGEKRSDASRPIAFTYGTINCLALNEKGEMSGVTTTSGLSWKLSGRVGDSPIVGAGLYVDNDVGAAGSTGRGEANIKICGAHTIVEMMRGGVTPTEAVKAAIERVVKFTVEKRLLDSEGKPNFDLKFYALSKDGRFAGASIWSGGKFAVFSGGQNRLEDCAFLFQRPQKS
ncbi:MAG: N(4)-(beta-N-acetylglucosaminyl)-L-asparaginase [Planctomycetes bacterium]|nr:N(4)-(beta-N-acetylglucosaminyl)-L-asparaginase [Planctomycetota bacterium]MBI3834595.1 N(4)-(beta-N-acetylglucosaminyl)-L-asparaginase [Planctomycetota bacterium]